MQLKWILLTLVVIQLKMTMIVKGLRTKSSCSFTHPYFNVITKHIKSLGGCSVVKSKKIGVEP